MSDVSAVVLTMGEVTTALAVERVRAQDVPLHEVIVVENVAPFSRALNQGAARVSTPFLLQVDADMILDPHCVATLLRGMHDDTAIVVGELRDALEGQVVGVKLFRSACYSALGGMPDTISPDTDFSVCATRVGWRIACVDSSITVGEHRPAYEPAYTHRKYLLEGARYRHRGARAGLFQRMGRLEQSSHPMRHLAQLALGEGFFQPRANDALDRRGKDERGELLTRWLDGSSRASESLDVLMPLAGHARLKTVYEHFLALGRRLRDADAPATVRDVLDALTNSRHDWRALVGKIALAHGLALAFENRRRRRSDDAAFARFIRLGVGDGASAKDIIRARVLSARTGGLVSRAGIRW